MYRICCLFLHELSLRWGRLNLSISVTLVNIGQFLVGLVKHLGVGQSEMEMSWFDLI